ncbi:flagellar hook protein FlgE [Chitinibacter tainanensis]|uniref:flagellar hook protein FlgE n=1 Tax=Chitinibacter tainanensis TaxID=230667 RepID=UPI0004163C9D|nr:flagellar hook protein FlgE [Chitinibacter tainanensis]
MGFQQGLSGLNAAAKNLDVIGNNVANVNTVGFKGSRAEFADIYASTFGTAANIAGIGAKVTTIAQQFSQGNTTTTNSPLDIAITGNGFFRMQDQTGSISYARNGQFQLDKEGFIVNNGQFLTGWPVDAGTGIFLEGSTPQPIQLQFSNIGARATGASGVTGAGLTMGLNLNAADKVIPASITFSSTDPTTYNYSTSATVYDSLGVAHTQTYYFRKQDPAAGGATNTWDVRYTLDGKVVNSDASIGVQSAATIAAATTAASIGGATAASVNTAIAAAAATEGTAAAAAVATAAATAAAAPGATAATVLAAAQTASATAAAAAGLKTTLTFDTNGKPTGLPTGGSTFSVSAAALNNGSSGLNFQMYFDKSTQFGSPYNVNTLTQDGYTDGILTGISVSKEGVVQGRYSNGQSRNVAKIVLSTFTNPQGLQPLGDNRWAESFNSGQPLTNAPGRGNTGLLQAAALEDSNVDLTSELVNLITAQRNYQANAQTVKAQDTIMQTIVNLR